MNKFILCTIESLLILITVACDGSSLRYQMQKKSLESGIVVDTTMFNICFNDDPLIVKQKLSNTGYSDVFGNFEYHFLNDKLYDLKWEWDSSYSFHNDSLVNFRLKTKGGDPDANALHELSKIFSGKYGQPFVDDNNYYWYKGNLEIGISLFLNKGYGHNFMSIVYKNIDAYFEKYNQKYKSDEHGNSYSKVYWRQNYEPLQKKELEKYQKNIENAGKDI